MPQRLVVQSHVLANSIVVKAVGELNLATAMQLDDLLREMEKEHVEKECHGSALMVDLCQTEYIDSAGLKVLLDARKRLSLNACSLHLRLAVGSQPAQVASTSRLDTIMTLLYE